MRKLATVRKIDSLSPIKRMDRVELAKVDGWRVIVKKGEFVEGDECLFFEIDSLLPVSDDRFSFLSKEDKDITIDGNRYALLKTVKMFKQISQGLALPLDAFRDDITLDDGTYRDDIDQALGIIKYVSDDEDSDGASNFPMFIEKTSQERIQNIFKYREEWDGVAFLPTLKLDGMSCTLFATKDEKYVPSNVDDGHFLYVCSNNVWLNSNDGETGILGVAVKDSDMEKRLFDVLEEEKRNLAFQFEMVSGSIKKGREGFKTPTLIAYGIYDIDNGQKMGALEAFALFEKHGIMHVPIIGGPIVLNNAFMSIEDYENYANNLKPVYASVPEGVVFHSLDGEHSFKCISPKYLLKHS